MGAKIADVSDLLDQYNFYISLWLLEKNFIEKVLQDANQEVKLHVEQGHKKPS